MRVRKIKIAVLFIILALGQFRAEAANPQAGDPINVVFIGDSITYGASLADRFTEAAPVACVKALKQGLPNHSLYFSNQGYCGNTTSDFMPNGKNSSSAFSAAKDLEAAHPGLLMFSIMLGTNDSSNNIHISNLTYHDNLAAILNRLLAEFPNSKIILNYPIWYSPNTHNGWDYEGDSAANRLKSYFPKIDALVTEYQASSPNHVFRGDTFAYNQFSINFQTQLTPENGTNGIFYLHPNAVGAAKLGEFWANAILQNVLK